MSSPPSPAPPNTLALVATCALGLEEILAEELRSLGMSDAAAGRGAVTFSGGWSRVWRANLHLRTANRVLVELASWPAADGDSLYGGVKKLVAGDRVWDGVRAADLFQPDRTFAVRATARQSRLTDARWIALRVKDGVVDAQRERWGRRANVDRKRPDLSLRALMVRDRMSLLLDTSGAPLDRRGYREVSGEAPVRESLGAAVVLAASMDASRTGGWDGTGPVVDPMCGTGTLLAEAGWIAQGRAPGADRKRWAFQRLPGFDEVAFDSMRKAAQGVPLEGTRLFGRDHNPQAVAAARANLKRAGLWRAADIEGADTFQYVPPAGPGLLVINPPYGERLTEEPEAWKRLGDLMKQSYSGYTAAVLAGDAGKGKHIGLRPRRRVPVKNGPLDARILVFDLY